MVNLKMPWTISGFVFLHKKKSRNDLGQGPMVLQSFCFTFSTVGPCPEACLFKVKSTNTKTPFSYNNKKYQMENLFFGVPFKIKEDLSLVF